MTFLSPSMLWLLLTVPPLVAGYVLLQRRRRTYVARFTNLKLLAEVAPRRPGWRRHAAAGLLLATLVMLLFSLARPALSIRVPKERASIVLVIDVSRSMAATDLQPDRMTAAKRAAEAFVDSLPSKLRVAVVAFSDSASVVSPLAVDRAQTRQAIRTLQPIRGTAIGEGLAAALGEIERERSDGEDVPAAVLLLSDGESNQGRPSQEVAQDAEAMNVPVYTVGVGTVGATLEYLGRILPVDLDEAELQAIGEITDAAYFRTADAASLQAVYADLGSKLGFVTEKREATAAAAGIAAVLLVGAAVASLLWFQRVP